MAKLCLQFFLTLFVLVCQVELKFRVGDIIYVYGDMDEDGFFTVSGAVTSIGRLLYSFGSTVVHFTSMCHPFFKSASQN